MSEQTAIFHLGYSYGGFGQLWEDTVYTIGNAEVSHPEPDTLQVAKSRKVAKVNAIIVIVLFALWNGMILCILPEWRTYVWTEGASDPPSLVWLLLLVGFFLGSLWLLLVIFRYTRIAREGDAFVFAAERGTMERNGKFVARFADVARVEITRELIKGEYSADWSHTLLVVLKNKRMLGICEYEEPPNPDMLPEKQRAVLYASRRQLTDLARELARILGVEATVRTKGFLKR